MPRNSSLLQVFRKIHLYFGMFISPALLFFAFTGAYQTLGLHEPSSNYKPASILASLGQIHKKQTYVVPVRKPGNAGPESGRGMDNGRSSGRGEGAARTDSTAIAARTDSTANPVNGAAMSRPAAGPPQATLQTKQKQHLPLKVFFVLVSLGLFTSTLTGIYMSYKYDRNKALVTGLLLAGVVLPIVLLRF